MNDSMPEGSPNPTPGCYEEREEMVMEWRDIASAPKDERYVLLCGPDGIDKGRWESHWGDGAWLRPFTAEYDNDGAVITDPTAWQPLPDPPTDWAPQGFVRPEVMEE